MNRIFKVIFSKTLGTNVVAGETAKSHGKKSLKAVAAVAMMAGVMGTGSGVMAADMESWNDGQKHIGISGDFDNANVPNARINVDGADSILKVTGEVNITSTSSDSSVIYPIAVSVTGTNAEAILGSQTTEEIRLSAESSNGEAKALQVTSKATLTGKSVYLTAKSTSPFASNGGAAMMVLTGHAEITANNLEVQSNRQFGIHVGNNTENPMAPEGAASIKIDADKITVTNTAENGLGLSAFSNGQMNINGDLTVNATNAIDARGNSTININTDGVHKTVLNGDIVFETPNMPGNAQQSGKIINANVNVVLNGSDSVWNGKAYQYYDNGTSVELEVPPYHGNVTGFKVNLSNGAVWNASGDSFVNDLEVDNATVNISDNAEKLNITNLAVDDAVINVTGQDTQIKTKTLSGDATVNLATESNGNGTFN
ncbi:MAG: ESPR domain-containing protein, partial [Oxalobacter sp.]